MKRGTLGGERCIMGYASGDTVDQSLKKAVSDTECSAVGVEKKEYFVLDLRHYVL